MSEARADPDRESLSRAVLATGVGFAGERVADLRDTVPVVFFDGVVRFGVPFVRAELGLGEVRAGDPGRFVATAAFFFGAGDAVVRGLLAGFVASDAAPASAARTITNELNSKGNFTPQFRECARKWSLNKVEASLRDSASDRGGRTHSSASP